MKNVVSLLCCIFVLGAQVHAQKEKISVDDLISRHAAAIGTSEAREAARSLVLMGQGTVSSKIGYIGCIGGPAQFASVANNFLFAMVLNSNEYPYERLAFNGKDLSFGRPAGSSLTKLGEFVKSQSSIAKQGLLGGALSTNWALARADKTKIKMEYAGIDTLGGGKYHKLKLRVRGTGELRVSAYFEPDTFRHKITVYEYSVAAYFTSAVRTENSSAQASHFSLTEQFSDFKQVGSLTLPMTYSITISSQDQGQTESLTWNIEFKQAYFNEPLEASAFKVS